MDKLILALDCSLRWTNVALSAESGVLVSERMDIGRRQAGELPLIVERALSEAGRSFRDVGLIAVTNGPGYFTGIRIGVSYAAALAYGLGLKVVPVSTLRMLAHSHISRGLPVLAAVYAGRERVYAAAFGGVTELPPGEYGANGLEPWLSRNENAALVSDDPQKIAETLSAPFQQVLLDAAAAAEIARLDPQTAVSPLELKVFYYRQPQVS